MSSTSAATVTDAADLVETAVWSGNQPMVAHSQQLACTAKAAEPAQYWASGGGPTGTYLYCSEVLAPSAWLGMSRPRCTANAALTAVRISELDT